MLKYRIKNHSTPFIIALVLTCCLSFSVLAQVASRTDFDLSKCLIDKKLKVVNRNASALQDEKYRGIHLDAKANDGVAWLENVSFSGGVIECDIKGKDVFQQSFLGIAFNGQNDETYEGIYFRPFNFKAEDSLRRMHAVQYIFHPGYSWDKLRKEFPEVYENPVEPSPDPNGWFHVRIVVAKPTISVYVNDAKEPSLVVQQLSTYSGGKIGLWVGNQSAGDFANLRISPAKKQ